MSFTGRVFFTGLGLVLLIGLALPAAAGAGPARAGPALESTPAPILIDSVPMSNAACLECHGDPAMLLPLPSGELVSLAVDRIEYGTSVHGQLGYACVQCHTDITGFPHSETGDQEARDMTIRMSGVCGDCHPGAREEYEMGGHAALLADGRKEAAVCADCHGAHSTEQFSAGRTAIAQACQQCHSGIYDAYAASIHGESLLNEFNVDVPTCVDCHDSHNNTGPTTEGFHVRSPNLCATCHADEELMSKYDINTNVFDTYIADFHGTTVSIFERTSPDQETNKPACIDCHGVHDIQSPEDTDSTVYKQNLLVTCQRCHIDATTNFSDSWLSHYVPDAENFTIVWLVDRFYKIFIPATLGGMAVFVVTDFWRSRIRK
ncbi:MAG TPA: cytochrome c3 family protein [Anaerolineales bacterium]|nr:cytochrome c3 family protein [Anaerolineales bacterium]